MRKAFTLYSNYQESSSEDMGFTVSQEKVLLRGTGHPDSYQIIYKQDTEVQIHISMRRPASLKISNERLTFNKKQKNETIVLTSENNCNCEVELLHLNHEAKKYFVKKVFILGSEGTELRTTGSDEFFMLAQQCSVSRLLEQMEFALETSDAHKVTEKVVKSSAEKVYQNFETLFLTSKKDECYVEYPYWVDVAVGEIHGICCSKDGRLYSWGNGIFGQLGLPVEDFVAVQKEMLQPKFKKIWTQKMQKVLFYHKMPNNLKDTVEKMHLPYMAIVPKLVQVHLKFKVTAVACGLFHSLILSEEGDVFSFGLGEGGRLGHKTEVSWTTPNKIEIPSKVTKIAAGYHNSFFILENKTVYSCGESSEGSSGHETKTLSPSQIPFLKDIHHISSSLNHTAVVTYSGKAILFGSNSDQKLGGPSPHTIDNISGERLRGVYCGGRHTCALTEKLEVYAWGYNTSGQLGLSSTMFHSMSDPVKVEYLSGRGVINLSLGWEHSTAITVDGLLYAWGSNTKGQLAIGTLAKEYRRVGLPRLIDSLLGSPVTATCAGRHSSFFITANEHPEKNSSLFAHWKRSLLYEERHMQELANYRFSLLIRDLKREQLVKKVEQERNLEIGRSVSSPKAQVTPAKAHLEIKGVPESYYAFWEESNLNVERLDDRTVVRFSNPVYYRQGRQHVVTMFAKPSLKKVAKAELDLRDVMAVASNQGARVEPRILGNNEELASRPVYYERMQSASRVTHGPSLLYPTLFPPYDLVPNSMLVAPK
jgi:alpha-tubulin suppressor-like RCC1 family protein